MPTMKLTRTATRMLRQPATRHANRRGFTLIELLIVVAIILVIAAIAIPSLLRSRIAANEAASAEGVRTITTASLAYSSTWGNGYPPSLSALGGSGTTATCDQANLIDPILSNPPYEKSGYIFSYTGEAGTVTVGGGCSSPGYNGYLVATAPQASTTGVRSFCSDEPGTIHVNTAGTTINTQTVCESLPALQ